jgi:ankyrin repeat protein
MNLTPLPFRASLDQYKTQAKEILRAYKSADPVAMYFIRQMHPRLRGRHHTNDRNDVTNAEIRSARVTLADAQCVVARWYGFENWEKLADCVDAVHRPDSPVAQFESAVEAIIYGDVATLQSLLCANPKLVRARSLREHRATLLHYVGANGIEDYRQKTPPNAVVVARVLLKAGADVDADLDYGPVGRRLYPERVRSTTLGMVATSVHPAAGGVQIALLKTLLKAGASIDGIQGGWNPVIAALHNGRGHAAQFLAKHGARLDLEGAAGTGQLEVVKRYFKKDGSLKSTATKEQMESGYMWACEYGHPRVVAFLLRQCLDIGAHPHGETGLHWAAYSGHSAIVRLLVKHNAPLDAKDKRYQGTPLGWALYGWCNPAPEANRTGYYDAVARLVDARATVDPEWLADPIRETPFDKKLRADARMRAALRGLMH